MSTKDTLARLAADDDDPFGFIGRKAPKPLLAEVPPPEPVGAPVRLKQITARLDEELHRRLKLYLATTGEEQQELIARLLSAHFDAGGLV